MKKLLASLCLLLASASAFAQSIAVKANGDGTLQSPTSFFTANGLPSGNTALLKANNLSDVASASTSRTNLGLAIGTNVQAWSANLDSWSAKTPYSGTLSITSGKTANFTNTLTLSGTDGSTLNVGAGGTLGSNAFTSTAFVPQTTTVNGHPLSANVTVTPTDLSLVIGTNVQAWSANLDSWATKTAPSGTVVGTSDSQTLTNKTISGSSNTLSNIGNGSLTNSSITIAGHSVSLGGSQSLSASDVGLGSVTNDAQAKASIYTNTPGTSGQVSIWNGSANVPQTISGDSTISSSGVVSNLFTKFTSVTIKLGPFNLVTSGSPTDISSVTLPSWMTRYTDQGSIVLSVTETASGTLTGTSFSIYDGAGGTGNDLADINPVSDTPGNIETNGTTNITTVLTSGTLHIRQTGNSAHAGSVSAYIILTPLP